MSFSYNQTVSINSNGTGAVSGTVIDVGNNDLGINQAVGANQAALPLGIAFNGANLQAIILTSTANMTLYVNAAPVNEVQSVIATGATAGTFTLSFGGQTTGTIAWNATAATVQTALTALPSIGAGNVACSGGPLPGTAVSVAFQGTLGGAPQSLMTANSTGLTGGTAAVTETTHGVAPFATINLVANAPYYWSRSAAYFANPLNTNVTNVYATTTAACVLKGRALTN